MPGRRIGRQRPVRAGWGYGRLAVGLGLVLLSGPLAAAAGPQSAATLGDELGSQRLRLGRFDGGIEPAVARRLAQVAPAGAMATWEPGRTIAEQAHRVVRYEYPLDLVAQYRVPLAYCPTFWPEHEPGRTVADFCYNDLLTNWQLEQELTENPLDIALEEAHNLNNDASLRQERLFWMLGYLWVHRGHEDAYEGAVDLLLSRPGYGRQDVLVSLLGPPLLALLPEPIKRVAPGEGEVSVDLRVTIGLAYDSVATAEETVLTGAKRGLAAVAIAGRGELGEPLAAQRAAAKLQKRGELPADFRVIVGEYIQTQGGAVVGLFLRDRVLEGMTLTETVSEIHKQGGLAYLARPGDIGAPAALRRLPFDGYLIQAGNFELFRTLELLNDPRFADKPALYASNSIYSFGTGLPYTNVPLVHSAADPLRAGLAAHQAYAAGPLYLPWMLLLLAQPVAMWDKALNRYFELNEALAVQAGKLIGVQHVILRTSWDDEMRNLMSLSKTSRALRDFFTGDSPLQGFPRLTYLEAEYGRLALTYDRGGRAWWLSTRFRW